MSRASALLALVGLLAGARAARGQACCAGATAFAPARLAIHEDALVGVMVRAQGMYGSFHGNHFAGSPPGDDEADFEQDLIAAVRLWGRLQLAATLPLVETWRRAGGLSEGGGGLGDAQFAARYDFTLAGGSRKIPGIAALAGVTVPSGKASSDAGSPLATDATGTGAFQAAGGLALEQAFGAFLVNLTGGITWRAPVRVGNLDTQQGLLWSLFAALAYTITDDLVVALTAAYTAELDARVDGVTQADSGRSWTRLAVAVGWAFHDDWRLQATVYSDLPVAYLGRNMDVGGGATLMVVRTW